ncbi:class I SAM-dependent methyltransferase [Pelagibacterium xiamenense]|uniref:class I SAM-dependent methyltransferase n=1 Tax=Pelagibacterium xiamenense TaxID=2901140 RepID=UPI001E5C0C76|nr:class I SAM-dependent methyltransferase [Pelagibacterium xiamenense]MCD7058841.1 class I SAM-dependent methyltransferase [Pelagibacterium xiamenense]
MADKTPTRRDEKTPQAEKPSARSEIADFISQVGAMTAGKKASGPGRGRLLFALDATMSRQPTWDLACQLQAEMFETVAKTGGLDVQLIFFRGFGECQASKWVRDARALADLMTGIDCRGGHTQISKVLSHARNEHKKEKINAVVYVGDAMEEDIDKLAQKAGELGLLHCPIFLFQEGHDRTAETAFREFARLTKGAYARFDSSAPHELAALLRAVAAYASGGREALKLQKSSGAQKLLEQLR